MLISDDDIDDLTPKVGAKSGDSSPQSESFLKFWTEMREAGYQPMAPSIADVLHDGALCRDMRCPACGHQGMLYVPWTKGSEYRIFAVCSNIDCENRLEVGG